MCEKCEKAVKDLQGEAESRGSQLVSISGLAKADIPKNALNDLIKAVTFKAMDDFSREEVLDTFTMAILSIMAHKVSTLDSQEMHQVLVGRIAEFNKNLLEKLEFVEEGFDAFKTLIATMESTNAAKH